MVPGYKGYDESTTPQELILQASAFPPEPQLHFKLDQYN